MPQHTASRLAAERATARSLARVRENHESNASMRDITTAVQNAPVRTGDTTNNGECRARKLTDRVQDHADTHAYAVDDTRLYSDGRLVGIHRSPSKLIVRNDDGTTSVSDTLALVSRWRIHRASNRMEGGK